MSQKIFIKTFGCQMNEYDSNRIYDSVKKIGYKKTENYEEANCYLLNTCHIRDKAKEKVYHEIGRVKKIFRSKQKPLVIVAGCVAQAENQEMLKREPYIDIVIGPQSYHKINDTILNHTKKKKKIEETEFDAVSKFKYLSKIKNESGKFSSYLTIQEGCDKFCHFCVVPYTRGPEHSRSLTEIIVEAKQLINNGAKEITLLGQNVDSYKWNLDIKGIVKDSEQPVVRFAELLEMVAKVNPDLRVRFSTSHPKDMVDDVLHVISRHENLCKYIHLPIQSGSSSMLKRMNRGYTREWYLDRIAAIKRILPDCALSTDIITGFCGETEQEHAETMSILKEVGYIMAYNFKYSERPRTLAERKYEDDVPEEVKSARLTEIIKYQRSYAAVLTQAMVGKVYKVLVEGVSKKSADKYYGRTTHNTVMIFDKGDLKLCDYVNVRAIDCTSATLIGEVTTDQAVA